MDAYEVKTNKVGWEELTGFPGKGQVKVLREEGGSKAKTLLIRIPAGGEIVPHAHMAAVQHYVLNGQYESEGLNYGPGSYRLLPAHAEIGPITTQSGATVLMVYDPVS